MSLFRNLPIRRKLTLIILVTSAAALLLGGGAMVVYELIRFRHSLVRELSTEAEIIAANSAAALAFNDSEAGVEILKALQARPAVVHACLFTPTGEILAEYKSVQNTEELPTTTLQSPGHRFEPGYVIVFEDVVFGEDLVGSLMVRSNLREQNAWLKASASIAVVALLTALLVALIMSLKLQGIISTPVLDLADVAHRVTLDKDFSLRATKRGNDEIGLLTEEFNQMLAQIEKQDADLRASEGRFRQLAESIREVFWLTNVEKNQVFYISPAFETIWGRSCQELGHSPRVWLDSIHSEDRARILEAATTKQTSGQYDEEYRIIRPDGTIRWVHDRAFPVRDHAGKIYRLAGIAEDITTRKEVEAALQQAEANYRSIFENAIDGIFQTTPEGRYLAANPAMARMLGYQSPEELIACITNLGEEICVRPETRLELHRRLVEEGQVQEFENELYRKDHSKIWISLNAQAVRDNTGAILYYEGTIKDITERKRIQEALRQSEAKYRQLVELAQEGIWSVDTDGSTTYANPHMAEMLGYSMEEMAGKHLFEFMDAAGIELCKRNMERRKQGISEQHEFEFIRKDGVRILTSMEAAPITDTSGNYCGAIACVSDITERRRAEETLRRTEQFYRQAITGAGAVPYARDYKTRSYLYMGEGIQELIGYAPDEVSGGIWKQIAQESVMLGEGAGMTVEEAGKQVASGKIKTWRCDMRVETRDGQLKWISDVSVPRLDESGQLIGSMGILQDVTERKRAEMKIMAFSSMASRLSAASTPEQAAANILDTAMELIGWDCGFVRLYDQQRDIMLPILTVDLLDGKRTAIPATEFQGRTPILRYVMQNGPLLIDSSNRASLPFQFAPFGDKNRSSTSMIYVPIRQNGNAIGVLSIQRYTSNIYTAEDLRLLQALADHCSGALQRIKATNELLETEAKYRRIFEDATEGIFQSTPDGRYVNANPALARMFGYESPEVMMFCVKNIERQTYVLPEKRREWMQLLESQKYVHGFEAERFRRDGSRFWISVNVRAVRDSQNKVLYYEGTVRDITTRRHLEKQLIEISDREQSRMGQDLHDGLCQHLVRTAFAVNLLEKDLSSAANAQIGQARKVSQLVDDAITQARNLARGLYPVKLEVEGLHSAMQELAANIRLTYNVDCEFESADSISISDHAVATHLYRIAQEAAINSVKHATPRQIRIQLRESAQKIHLTICDDGTGIHAVRGSGMGLHIMNYRAGMIGGSLKIESQPGGGTMVSCIFAYRNGIRENLKPTIYVNRD